LELLHSAIVSKGASLLSSMLSLYFLLLTYIKIRLKKTQLVKFTRLVWMSVAIN